MSYLAAIRPIIRKSLDNKTIVVCSSILILIAAVALIGPLVSPHHYAGVDFEHSFMTPSATDWHLFGTIIASVVSLGIGVAYGAIAGYVGGNVDAIMMRAVDALYALPFIFFVILLMVVFERNFLLIFVAIGAINWLDMARIVRGQTLSLKQQEFVDAARLIGVSTRGIIFRHITPNLFGVVVVYMTLTIPQAILVESFLSFLGLGVQEPQTSLGALVNGGVSNMERAPWLLLIPAIILALILLCFNFLGDGLRDAVDPKKKT
jgi:oligopeptide transport system permease protein